MTVNVLPELLRGRCSICLNISLLLSLLNLVLLPELLIFLLIDRLLSVSVELRCLLDLICVCRPEARSELWLLRRPSDYLRVHSLRVRLLTHPVCECRTKTSSKLRLLSLRLAWDCLWIDLLRLVARAVFLSMVVTVG